MSHEPEHHARRAALYAYAAAAHQYPDEDTVADLRDEEVRSAVAEAAEAIGLGDAFAELAAALDATDSEELASAYDDLFGLPGEDGTYPVVPYEADYTAGDDVSESQRRIATVVGLLDRFGLEPAPSFDERQDHLAAELELMQVVAGQRAVVTEDGRAEAADRLAAAEATILDEHLTDFVPAFARDVADAGGGRAYVAAASFAARLVERDAAAHPDPPREAAARAGGDAR